jgi:hypothetical protein
MWTTDLVYGSSAMFQGDRDIVARYSNTVLYRLAYNSLTIAAA